MSRWPWRRAPEPEPVADLTADTVLRRLGATHDTRGRFTGRRGARPMCRPDDFPPFERADLTGNATPVTPVCTLPGSRSTGNASTSPWVRAAQRNALPASGPVADRPRRESLADVLRRTLPRVEPVEEPVTPIHPAADCPFGDDCIGIHTVGPVA